MVQKNAINTGLNNIFNMMHIAIAKAFVNDFGKGTKKDVDALGALAVVFYDVFLERASHIAGEDDVSDSCYCVSSLCCQLAGVNANNAQ